MPNQTFNADRIPRLREPWLRLLPQSPTGFFLHPDWCHAVWTSFGTHESVKIHALVKDGEVVGLLPVWLRRMNRFGLFQRISETFGGGRGDYSHPLLEASQTDEDLADLIEAAVQGAKASGALVLANVPDREGWSERVRTALESKGFVFSESRKECLHVSLPDSFAEFASTVKSRLRTDIRRRLRKLRSEVGETTFELVTSPEEAQALLPILFEMHDRRWVEVGRPGAFSDPRMRAYFSAMVDRVWEHLHVSVLRTGGSPVALHFGMRFGGSLLHFKPTFEAQLSQYSPGKIHLWMLMEQAIKEDLSMLDFLQGDEVYKEEWATGSVGTSTFVVQTRPRALAYWWVSRGRRLAEYRLGKLYMRLSSLFHRFPKRKQG